MNTPEEFGQPHGMGLRSDAGMIQINKVYGGDALPPGSVAVEERVLARYVPPGTKAVPHGVPPIGEVFLPGGSISTEGSEEADQINVLPFRFPFYSRAYALSLSGYPFAVIRNVQPDELTGGNWVVVQFNDSGDWSAIFGRIGKMGVMSFELQMPDGSVRKVSHDEVQFVGKVMAWWQEGLCG